MNRLLGVFATRASLAAVLALALAAPRVSAEEGVLEWFADLEERFVVERIDKAGSERTVRLRSAEPIIRMSGRSSMVPCRGSVDRRCHPRCCCSRPSGLRLSRGQPPIGAEALGADGRSYRHDCLKTVQRHGQS